MIIGLRQIGKCYIKTELRVSSVYFFLKIKNYGISRMGICKIMKVVYLKYKYFFQRGIMAIILLILFSCSTDDIIIDNGDGIAFEFIDGLNDDERYKLPKDENGYYYLTLDGYGQTIQRIAVKLSRNGDVVYSSYDGYSHNLEWSSNLYWWLLEGDVVANITRTYFNPFTGEIQYINLPPLVNWQEQLIPTINSSSYTDEDTGIGNIVIAPIQEMLGDTLIISVRYKYKSILFKDSINIILK